MLAVAIVSEVVFHTSIDPTEDTFAVTLHNDTASAVVVRQCATTCRSFQERDLLEAGDRVSDPGFALARAEQELDMLQRARLALETGAGEWINTPVGRAAQQPREVERQHRQAEQRASADISRRDRRHWKAEAKTRAQREADARDTWQRLAGPEAEQLDAQIAQMDQRVGELRVEVDEHHAWQTQHPEALRRVVQLDREIDQLDRTLHPERHDLGRAPQLDRAVGWDRDAGVDRGLEWELEPPMPRVEIEPPDLGMDLGL